MQASSLLDLPADALALIVSHTNVPRDAVSLRRACRSLGEPANMGALLAISRILVCDVADVPERARAAPGDDPLETAAFVVNSHNGKKLAAAHDHSLLARGTSIVSCGANDAGQLGIGKVSQFNSTIIVPNTPHAAVYAARQQQMAEGFDPARPAVAQLSLPAGVAITSLAAGRSHSLAASSDGQLYAWGQALACGIASQIRSITNPAVQPVALPRRVILDVGDDDDLPAPHWWRTSPPMASEDTLSNAVSLRELHARRRAPLPPSRSRQVTQVAAGQCHSALLLSGGAVFCCGVGSAGELGDGHMCDSAAPVRARLPEAARAIAAGGFHTLAIGAGPARRAYGWGSSACRQLGDYTLVQGRARRLGGLPPSTTYGQATPAALATFARMRSCRDEVTLFGLSIAAAGDDAESDEAKVSAFRGVAPAVAVPLDTSVTPSYLGTTHLTGESGTSHGDGDGDTSDPQFWMDHRELPACAQLAAGSHHSLLLTQRGHVMCCGKNSNGQLGLGHRIASDPLSVVAALAHTRIVSIAAGASHSAFVDVAGRLYTCGRLANGRLGFDEAALGDAPPLVRTASDNTLTRPPMLHCARPTRVAFPSGVAACGGLLRVSTVVAGNDHTIALMTDGRAFSFGRGQAGQLASGSRNDRLQPELMLTVRGASGEGSPSASVAEGAAYIPVPVPAAETRGTTAGASGSWRSGPCVATFTTGTTTDRAAVPAMPDVSAREDQDAREGADEPPTPASGSAESVAKSEPSPVYTPICRSYSRW